MTQGKTLKQLDVKPGDVVRDQRDGEFGPIGADMVWRGNRGETQEVQDSMERRWEIVSRATPDAPTLWRDMTPEQKGALLLAQHEGKEVQGTRVGISDDWGAMPIGVDCYAYRIKPAPTRVTVDLFAGTTDQTIARIGTIEYQDGKPDAGSIKMEEVDA